MGMRLAILSVAKAWATDLFSSFALLLLLFLSALTVAGYVVYQLYFHPLARYRGPLLGRITPLPDLYHAFKGDKHLLLYRLHQQYGAVVRFTPNTLSINDPAAIKAIYSHNSNVLKGEFYKCFRATPYAISTLLATEKQQHARKRRVMGQAFSDQSLRGLEQYVLEHVQRLVDKINSVVAQPSAEAHKRWSETVDMRSWCNWLVFDVMGDLVRIINGWCSNVVVSSDMIWYSRYSADRSAVSEQSLRIARPFVSLVGQPGGTIAWLLCLHSLTTGLKRFFRHSDNCTTIAICTWPSAKRKSWRVRKTKSRE